jgi:hypothetical protein
MVRTSLSIVLFEINEVMIFWKEKKEEENKNRLTQKQVEEGEMKTVVK